VPRRGWTATWPAFVLLALTATPLTVIDFELHRLPNRLVFLTAVGAVWLFIVAAATSGHWYPPLRAAEAAIVAFAIGTGFTLVAPFGFGDAKLIGVLAAYLGWYGWGYVIYGIAAGFLLASLAVLPLVAVGRATMKSPIPLGPALIIGSLTVAAFDLVPAALYR
jgi:leader peptidase (prepilin peptidase)/N-methyltransferase